MEIVKGIFTCIAKEYSSIIIDKNYKDTAVNKYETFKRLFGQTKDPYPGLNRAERKKRLKNNLAEFNGESFIAKMKKAFLMT